MKKCDDCKKKFKDSYLVETENEILCLDCLKKHRQWFIKEMGLDKTHFICNLCLVPRMNEFKVISETFGEACENCLKHVKRGIEGLFPKKKEKGTGQYITISWVDKKVE